MLFVRGRFPRPVPPGDAPARAPPQPKFAFAPDLPSRPASGAPLRNIHSFVKARQVRKGRSPPPPGVPKISTASLCRDRATGPPSDSFLAVVQMREYLRPGKVKPACLYFQTACFAGQLREQNRLQDYRILAMDEHLKDDFALKTKAAVVDSLKHIKKTLDSGKSLGSIYGWADVEHDENGMPSFRSSFSGPTDYITAFYPEVDRSGSTHDPTKGIPSLRELHEFIVNSESLTKRILPPEAWEQRVKGEDTSDLVRFSTYYLAPFIAIRYVHVFKTTEFNQQLYQDLYKEYEQSVFAEKLNLEIFVPILFLKFSFAEARIDEQARIMRMDDDFHRARYSARTYGSGGHDLVLPCATHALVLENWDVENQNHFDLIQVFSSQNTTLIEHVDKFFGALRTICGQPTGYCQLLYKPVGWSQSWKGHLPQVNGTSGRAYPGFFENYYWRRDAYPLLGVDEISKCGIAFRQILRAEENSIAIAVRRLNRCYCRDDEEDWTIDATIALEALLSDGEPQEMTHKLALRVAAVSQLVPDQRKTAAQVFKDIKTVYKLRSQIVHGRAPSDKSRVIAISEKEHVPTSEVAREHLRSVLRVLIECPQYRKASNVDKLVFSRITSAKLDDEPAD